MGLLSAQASASLEPIGEVRWQPLQQSESLPLDLTLSFSPQWSRIDDATGEEADSYSGQAALLATVRIVPGKLFLGFNLICEPAISRDFDGWQNDSSFEVSLAAAYAVVPGVFVGAEIRHLNGSEQGLFSSHALYFGPSLYAKLSETFAIKVAWSEQVAGWTKSGASTSRISSAIRRFCSW